MSLIALSPKRDDAATDPQRSANVRRVTGMRVGPLVVSDHSPCVIVAELGFNHNGDMGIARRLIDAAAAAGADCAKFQMRDLRTLYRNEGDADDPREDLGSQYTLDLLSRFTLGPEQMFELFDHCVAQGIVPLCTPWDTASLSALARYGMPAYKIASADLTNHELLRAAAATGKPLFVSTGMSTEEEIAESAALLHRLDVDFVLLHCNSTYPPPLKDVNLRYLDRLRELGRCPVGYSGHERRAHVAVAAVARGARVLEKHMTLDRGMEGNDHKISLLPDEFAAMVEAVREVEEALGTARARAMTQGERMNRSTLAKSVVITCDQPKGALVRPEMLAVKSPGRGLQPNRMQDLVGRRLGRDMRAGDFFYPSDLGAAPTPRRTFSFRRPWGLAVRYHDYQALSRCSNPDFLEFHMSFKDLDIPVGEVFDAPLDVGLVVHSPDLFSGDHILNLAADDDAYRRRSVDELARVLDVARAMQPYFARAESRAPAGGRGPKVVVSMGGFSTEGFVSRGERWSMYERVADSLRRLDTDGVEVLAQTLPPFPWYRGGRLFCNLFVDPEDTAEFCRLTGTRLCLDIAHSQLAANHAQRGLADWVSVLADAIAHVHVVDAQGVDGEGLQIGDGDVDFAGLALALARVAPSASFIPEIWQGHVNDGEGFWLALERLEAWF
ncbi:MAG TPA: N-acetylneuraminate synthase family protein [Acidimicrobiales bacterium]|nr:N-acetylneuraminate synthase family protein [Acidimicrobiales bacterium]